jgi:hypothetical protein
MSKVLKHDFYDFVVINGKETCKHCLMTRDNEHLPTYCPEKVES